MSALKDLAKAIFDLTRTDVWLGGKGQTDVWPKSLKADDRPWGWDHHVTWTLSPEVELGGHRMRVCVSWSGHNGSNHRVRVFVDDEVKYPGGMYDGWNGNWFGGWSWKIAQQERKDGGKVGPVDTREAILAEARRAKKGVQTQHKAPLYCDMCFEALAEVERNFPTPASGSGEDSGA